MQSFRRKSRTFDGSGERTPRVRLLPRYLLAAILPQSSPLPATVLVQCASIGVNATHGEQKQDEKEEMTWQ